MARKKKANPRYCRLTSEGWIYIVIICFVAIGAILRNVNLLILATGMMLAPLIFNWRVCVVNLRTLSAKRVVPEHVHAQTPINVAWTCENAGGRLTARNLILHDRLHKTVQREPASGLIGRFIRPIFDKLESIFASGNQGEDFAHVCFQSVSKLDPSVVAYQCFFPRRGEFEVGPAELKTSFPFGLVACCIPLDAQDTIFVAPPLGQLHPTWERRINSMEVGGQSQMRRRGLEKDEFYAMRKWRSGDSRKDIHWRSTARLGFPMIKQFDQPNDRDFALLLDLHEDSEMTRLQCETILSFAATAVSRVASDVQGQLGVAVCGQQQDVIAGRQNRKTHGNVMRRLAIAKPTANPDIDASVVELASVISRGTPIYCISTRNEPAWLANGSTEISPALNTIKNLVRWIEVSSDDFAELFSMESFSEPEPEVKSQVESQVESKPEIESKPEADSKEAVS